MATNHVMSFEVIEAAFGAKAGRELFLLRRPGSTDLAADSKAWYGQAIDPNASAGAPYWTPTSDTYFGKPIIDNGGGWGGIMVDVVPLSAVLADYDLIDLLDMDVQGAEADVIDSSIDLLNKRVKLIHIGTHSTDIEHRIRTTLADAGWTNVWDFPLQSETQTPFGIVHFDDGVQTWKNLRLAGS